jgi:hypothetical protein
MVNCSIIYCDDPSDLRAGQTERKASEAKKFILDLVNPVKMVELSNGTYVTADPKYWPEHQYPAYYGKYAGFLEATELQGSHIFLLRREIRSAAVVDHRFKITFLKETVMLPTPDTYWAYYIQCLIRNETIEHLNLRLVDHNTTSRCIPHDIKFKNYLNFLRYLFKGKQKQAARQYYLKDLRTLPDAARNMEGGIKTFL